VKKKLFFPLIIISIIFLIGFINYKESFSNINDNSILEPLKIDLLTASVEDLIKLPYIGPSKANAIVKYRDTYGFSSVEDIKNVPGIGEKTFLNIKDYIYLSKSVYEVKDKTININTASFEQLIGLPGIGKVNAQKIIDYRLLKKIETLEELKKLGISSSTLKKIEGKVTF
jgi:competence protein ComEA